MLKKLMAAVLTGAMIFALAVPALADDPLTSGATEIEACADSQSTAAGSDSGYGMTIPGYIQVPELKLTVEGTPWVVLNPYSMKITGNEIASGLGTSEYTSQVIGADIKITNKSKADVIIGVKDLQGTAKGEAVISSKTLEGDTKTTTKSVFLFLSVAAAIKDAHEKTEVDTAALSGTMQITAAPKSNTALYRIVKNKDKQWDVGTAAYMTIAGNAVSSPTVSWASADGVDVSFGLTAKLSDDAA